jgi:hypothetical protein
MSNERPTWDEVCGAFSDAQVLANRYCDQNDEDCLECETLAENRIAIDRIVKELEAVGRAD